MKKKATYIGVLLFACTLYTQAQLHYQRKFDLVYMNYQYLTDQIQPSPNWKGNYISDKQNAWGFDLVNGASYLDKYFGGFGIGYQNVKGLQGITLYLDFDYTPFTGKWSPTLSAKMGYSRLMNEYPDGTGTLYTECNVGVSYKIKAHKYLYIQSGVLTFQKALFIPLRMGVRF